MPALERALLWISITGGICILTGLILLYWLPRSISKPIKELKEGILEIANHNYEKRLDMSDNEEFREVADSFNRMAERLTEYRASLRKRRHIYLFNTEDLDNDDIIAMVEDSPTYMRDKTTLTKIRTKAALEEEVATEEATDDNGVITF